GGGVPRSAGPQVAARGGRADGDSRGNRGPMALRGGSYGNRLHRAETRSGALRPARSGGLVKRLLVAALVLLAAACATRAPAPVVERQAPPPAPVTLPPPVVEAPPVEKPPEKPI